MPNDPKSKQGEQPNVHHRERDEEAERAEIMANIRRDAERERERRQQEAFNASDAGQAEAWWNSLKSKLTAPGILFKLESNLDYSQLGYYEFNEETQTMEKHLISGEVPPQTGDDEYEKDVLAGSTEPKGLWAISKIQKAMENGTLFMYRPSKSLGDTAFRLNLGPDGDLKFEDFKGINKDADAPAKEPKKPDGVGFWNRVKAFFGNSAAKQLVSDYNRDYAKYQEDKTAWDRAYGDCKTPEERNKRLNANRLAKNGRMAEDIKKTCDTYRLNRDKIDNPEKYKPQAKNEEIAPEQPKIEKKKPTRAEILQNKLNEIHNKYADFKPEEVKSFEQIKKIYSDALDVTQILTKGNIQNTQVGNQFSVEGSKIFSIIGDNKKTFDAIIKSEPDKSKLEELKKIENEISKNVHSLQKNSSFDKNKSNVEVQNNGPQLGSY